MKKWAVWMLVLLLCLTGSALAAGETAQIGTRNYATFDNAVVAAAEGDTIKLLADCTTEGIDLKKNLTVNGDGHKLTFQNKGIALNEKTLTFQNCTVEMNQIGQTAKNKWVTICASSDAVMNLENTTMTLDSEGVTGKHAIYFCDNNQLNLTDSKLTIKNYTDDALEWNGGNGGYNITMINSTYTSDHNRSGFTGTFYVIIDNSKVDVINSTGNGSNGSNYVIKNQSQVNFSDNHAHGLSAVILQVDHSTVTAKNNGANGVHVGSELKVINGSQMTITGNQCTLSSQYTTPAALYVKAQKDSVIDSTSKVTITDNNGSGLMLVSGKLTVEENAQLTIMRNTAVKLGIGGGVHNSGTLHLNGSAKLYNNHAPNAADDLYNADTATIIFGNVGAGWMLDGKPNHCTDAIDGWYEDGEKRWEAHAATIEGNHVVPEQAGGYEKKPLMLKAAHGILPNPPTQSRPKTGDDSHPFALLLMACLSMTAIVFITRRRQTN